MVKSLKDIFSSLMRSMMFLSLQTSDLANRFKNSSKNQHSSLLLTILTHNNGKRFFVITFRDNSFYRIDLCIQKPKISLLSTSGNYLRGLDWINMYFHIRVLTAICRSTLMLCIVFFAVHAQVIFD